MALPPTRYFTLQEMIGHIKKDTGLKSICIYAIVCSVDFIPIEILWDMKEYLPWKTILKNQMYKEQLSDEQICELQLKGYV